MGNIIFRWIIYLAIARDKILRKES